MALFDAGVGEVFADEDSGDENVEVEDVEVEEYYEEFFPEADNGDLVSVLRICENY